MREETPVLDGNHGVNHMRRQLGERHGARRAAAFDEDGAVACQHADDRRLLALTQGRRIGKADRVAHHGGGDQDRGEDAEEHGATDEEPQAPVAQPGAARVHVRCARHFAAVLWSPIHSSAARVCRTRGD